MKKNDLIAKQQLEIETLKERITKYEHNLSEIHQRMTCCGPGVFNDNTLGFTREQMLYLYPILGASIPNH